MKKSTLGDFDFFNDIHQIDLDSLLSFFRSSWRWPSAASSSPQKRLNFGPSTAHHNLADPAMNQAETDFGRAVPRPFLRWNQ